MTESELQILRRVFARQMTAIAGVSGNNALEDAFALVRRENFLGVDPWSIKDVQGNLVTLPENDPVYAYQDVLFSLSPSRGVNNGSPSLHAKLLARLGTQPGDRIVHIGAGTGYYTAMLAQLTGETGTVTAVEIDPVLGRMARDNLARLPNVTVVTGDGAGELPAVADRIYVNFSVGRPAAGWIEGLASNGRLVFPLGVPTEPERPDAPRYARRGAAFAIDRTERGFAASWICPAFFVWGEGSGLSLTKASSEALERAFDGGGGEFVRKLSWQKPADPARCWFNDTDWSLGYDEV